MVVRMIRLKRNVSGFGAAYLLQNHRGLGLFGGTSWRPKQMANSFSVLLLYSAWPSPHVVG